MLGIFGDSSADPVEYFNYSWVELLQEKFIFENFSARGSSLLFTYDKLLTHAHKFDRLLIFIAPPGRLWAPNCKIHQHFMNQKTVEIYADRANTFTDKKILKAIESYFNDLWLLHKELLQHHAIVDSIRTRYPNALLIPVTPHSIQEYRGLCMHDISLLDYEYYDVNEYVPDWGRTCHMNKENNKIFFLKIKEWLETGTFNVSIKDFKYPAETKEELFPNK
jgi:hypothetical protein